MTTILRQVSPEPIQLIVEDNDSNNCSDVNKSTKTISLHIKKVEIIEATILRDSQKGSKHTTYTLLITKSTNHITDEVVTFKVHKRYTDFLKLSQTLKAQFPQYKPQIPKLPPKTLLPGANFQMGFLERRRKGLEYFVSSILLNSVFQDVEAVRKFVEQDESIDL